MNNFTKEELKLLFGGLQLWMEEILYENEDDRCFRNNLYNKMQSMIDNYCELKKCPNPNCNIYGGQHGFEACLK